MAIVSKVDWDVAHLWYIKDSRMSYAILASKFGVSKSTVQAYGTKHSWSKDRAEFKRRRISNLLGKFDTDLDQVHAKHLKMYNNLLIVSNNALVKLQQQYESKPIDNKYSSSLSSIVRSLGIAITEERILLGLPTKGFAADPWFSSDAVNRNIVHVTDEEIEAHIKRYERYVKRIRKSTNNAIG